MPKNMPENARFTPVLPGDDRKPSLNQWIPNVSQTGIALLDAARIPYERYGFEVGVDDFDDDRSGGWGPGEYRGVKISHQDAPKWDEGLAAVRERGLKGPDAASLRLHILRGGSADEWDPDPARDHPLIARLRREARDRANAAERASKAQDDQLTRYRAIVGDRTDATMYMHRDLYRGAPDDAELLFDEVIVIDGNRRRPGEHIGLKDRRSTLHLLADGTLLWRHHGDGGGVPGGELILGTPEQLDPLRLAWAEANDVTIESAQEGVGSPYIGDDQRRMYQVFLAAHA